MNAPRDATTWFPTLRERQEVEAELGKAFAARDALRNHIRWWKVLRGTSIVHAAGMTLRLGGSSPYWQHASLLETGLDEMCELPFSLGPGVSFTRFAQVVADVLQEQVMRRML